MVEKAMLIQPGLFDAFRQIEPKEKTGLQKP